MAFDSWAQEFCLACDKQVHVEGAAYCSESCRLAESESAPSSSSQPTSPGFASSPDWASTSTRPSNGFFLSPAYEFGNQQPNGPVASQQPTFPAKYSMAPTEQPRPSAAALSLTPSSSYSSLCSVQTHSTTDEGAMLSDKVKKELRAYAVSFEQVRLQRRRSY